MAKLPRKVGALNLLKKSPPDITKLELLGNPKFFLEDGSLYYQGRGKYQKILYTPEEKRKAFEEAHIISEDRHHGIRATGVNITKCYYWPRITLHARQWVKECKKCQQDRLAEREARKIRIKAKRLKVKKEPTRPEKRKQLLAARVKKEPSSSRKMLPTTSGAARTPAPAARTPAPAAQARDLFRLVGLQLAGPLTQTPRGARYIFVVVDHLTRWAEAAPMMTCSPEETAEQILKLIYRFGFPERIICSQSSEFIRQTNRILRMKTNIHRNLVDFQPQIGALPIKTNSFVQKLLKMVAKKDSVNWDFQLQELLKELESESEEEEEEAAEGFSDSDESLPSAPFPKDPSEESPVKEPEIVTSLGMEDSCLYCNEFADKGDGDTFIMMQCDQCKAWVHQLCVMQHHSDESWRTKFFCKFCVPTEQP